MKTQLSNNWSRTWIWFWVILFLGLTFLSLNRHSKSKPFEYHSEIWADKAGYYIYLPATFLYHWDANQLPDSIAVKTGDGFSVDTLEHRIATKYTYGVALLEAPAFCFALAYEKMTHGPTNGFEKSFAKSINVSAVIYLVLGLFILSKILSQLNSYRSAVLASSLLLFGSNLFYYGICDTGMSHVYSFFAFVLFVWRLDRWIDSSTPKRLCQIGLACGLILIIRPINVLFIVITLILYFIENKISFRLISRSVLSIWFLMPIIVSLLPQVIYWYHLTGSVFHYSYHQEGFDHWANPRILEFLFSTNNGLFTYTPLWLAMLFTLFFCGKMNFNVRLTYGISFLLIVYTFSSWWSWYYGCSYGSRTMVEYSSIFFIASMRNVHLGKMKSLHYLLFLLLIAVNLKIIYSYDGCWYGGNWDYDQFIHLIIGPTK